MLSPTSVAAASALPPASPASLGMFFSIVIFTFPVSRIRSAALYARFLLSQGIFSLH